MDIFDGIFFYALSVSIALVITIFVLYTIREVINMKYMNSSTNDPMSTKFEPAVQVNGILKDSNTRNVIITDDFDYKDICKILVDENNQLKNKQRLMEIRLTIVENACRQKEKDNENNEKLIRKYDSLKQRLETIERSVGEASKNSSLVLGADHLSGSAMILDDIAGYSYDAVNRPATVKNELVPELNLNNLTKSGSNVFEPSPQVVNNMDLRSSCEYTQTAVKYTTPVLASPMAPPQDSDNSNNSLSKDYKRVTITPALLKTVVLKPPSENLRKIRIHRVMKTPASNNQKNLIGPQPPPPSPPPPPPPPPQPLPDCGTKPPISSGKNHSIAPTISQVSGTPSATPTAGSSTETPLSAGKKYPTISLPSQVSPFTPTPLATDTGENAPVQKVSSPRQTLVSRSKKFLAAGIKAPSMGQTTSNIKQNNFKIFWRYWQKTRPETHVSE